MVTSISSVIMAHIFIKYDNYISFVYVYIVQHERLIDINYMI